MVPAMKRKATVPPYWVDFAVGICFFIFGLFMQHWMVSAGIQEKPIRNPRLIIGISILVILESCFHFSIGEKGIIVRFLYVPIRLIEWEKVSTAEYIYKWNTGVKFFGDMEGQGIFVTLQGCPYFCPEIDALNMFKFRHPFSSLFIRFTPRHQKDYVDIFKQYYPNLDFQFGAEKNLQRKR